MVQFTYNASAVAGGGVIEKSDGSFLIVPSLAPVALSPAGGEGVAVQHNYSSPEVSFSFAETRVFGREIATNVFHTETNVYITNLRVLDVLSIAALQANVKSTRVVDPNDHDDDHEFELDASYVGVVAHDPKTRTSHPVAPKIDVSMKGLKRYRDLKALVDRAPRGGGDKKLLERFDNAPADKVKEALGKGRPILGALVENVDDEVPAKRGAVRLARHANKLHIPGVGTVRFGELMLKPGRRRVNLLRFEFGPNALLSLRENAPQNDEEGPDLYTGGSLTMASVEGNGSPLYP